MDIDILLKRMAKADNRTESLLNSIETAKTTLKEEKLGSEKTNKQKYIGSVLLKRRKSVW